MKKLLPSKQYFYYDAVDEQLISKYKWHLANGYVQTETGNRKNNKRKTMRLHRLIMQAEPGQIIDHINRNPLDNRRSNLRFADKSTNAMNRLKQSNNTSGKKGVAIHTKTGKWRAYITIMKKTTHLGLFNTKEAAAEAYDAAAKILHGEFARTNK